MSVCVPSEPVFFSFACLYIYTLVFFCCVSRPGGRIQRAAPWQLRQEDSDAVWNELAYLKNLTRKLSIEK